MKVLHIVFCAALAIFAMNLPADNRNDNNRKGDNNNRREGKVTVYRDNNFRPVQEQSKSTFRGEVQFHNGKVQGTAHYTYPSGHTYAKPRMAPGKPDQVADGPVNFYYENGQKMRTEHYHNGQANGPVDMWDHHGNHIGQGEYRDGHRWGHWREWSGGNYWDGDYYDNLRVGLWVSFDANNDRLAQGNYVNGLMDGYWIFWYPDGTEEAEGNYVMGAKDGWWKEWDQNGNLSEGNYSGGVKVGDWSY